MHEIKAELEEVRGLVDQGLKKVDLPTKKIELEKLNLEMQRSDFWDDQQNAQSVSQKASSLGKIIESWENITSECDELLALLPTLSEEEPEMLSEYKQMAEAFLQNWRKLEISTFLNGKYDTHNAILSLHAGTGGTDAMDFAEMLLRMYSRYGEKMGYSVEILDKSMGEEAGIKSCTFVVKGEFAYGYLKGEAGVHRLVRMSPFNSKGSRETSFVLLEVLPEINHDSELEIDKEDLRVDVFRSSGSGGQSVNTTDSAVRITHVPTGLVVQCQNERSQIQNRERCMQMLAARLLDLMEKEHANELKELKGKKVEMSWGNQIRSYVLHPYKMVKDHRTDYEEGNPDKVLDGELDGFIEAELKKV